MQPLLWTNMAIASLKIGRQNFVVVPQKDFARLQRESEKYRRLREEDDALGELATKELRAFRKRGSKGIVWEELKKEL